jgi:hypothetical protein
LSGREGKWLSLLVGSESGDILVSDAGAGVLGLSVVDHSWGVSAWLGKEMARSFDHRE